MVLWNAQYEVVDVNDAFLRQYGYTRERGDRPRLSGRAAAARTWPSASTWCAARSPARHATKVARAFRKDGSSFAVELRVIPFRHRGEPHVLAIARDITERQRAIAERQVAEAALRDSEEQYRAIFNASADGLLLRDRDFRIVDVNPAYLAMKGFTREELLGRRAASRGRRTGRRRAPTRSTRACSPAKGALRDQRAAQGRRWVDVEVRGMPVQYHGQLHALYSAARHLRTAPGRGRARCARRPAAPGAEDGGDRPADRRHRARLQQHPGEHHGLRRARRRAAERRGRRAPCRAPRAGARVVPARARPDPADARLRARARGGRRRWRRPTIVREAAQLLRVTLPSTIGFEVDPGDPALAVTLDPVQAQQVLLNLCINARDALGGSGRHRPAGRQPRRRGGRVRELRQVPSPAASSR